MAMNSNIFKNLLITFGCDAPRPWSLYFQDSSSPKMEAIIELHNYVMFFLVTMLIGVMWVITVILYNFVNNKLNNIYLKHGTFESYIIKLICSINPNSWILIIYFLSWKFMPYIVYFVVRLFFVLSHYVDDIDNMSILFMDGRQGPSRKRTLEPFGGAASSGNGGDDDDNNIVSEIRKKLKSIREMEKNFRPGTFTPISTSPTTTTPTTTITTATATTEITPNLTSDASTILFRYKYLTSTSNTNPSSPCILPASPYNLSILSQPNIQNASTNELKNIYPDRVWVDFKSKGDFYNFFDSSKSKMFDALLSAKNNSNDIIDSKQRLEENMKLFSNKNIPFFGAYGLHSNEIEYFNNRLSEKIETTINNINPETLKKFKDGKKLPSFNGNEKDTFKDNIQDIFNVINQVKSISKFR